MMFHKNVWVFIFIYGLLKYSSVEAVEIRAIFSNNLSFGFLSADIQRNFDSNSEYFSLKDIAPAMFKKKISLVGPKLPEDQGDKHKTQVNIPINYFKRCSFSRCGLEYCLESMRIYVEEIEGLPLSIEVVGQSRQEILNLFKDLKVTELLTDSVPQWYLKEVL